MQNQDHQLKKVQPKKEMKQMLVFQKRKLAKCLTKFNAAKNNIDFKNNDFKCENSSCLTVKKKIEQNLKTCVNPKKGNKQIALVQRCQMINNGTRGFDEISLYSNISISFLIFTDNL